jgi:mannose-6-phosphate isomerase-like protein (cupin superfamily)
MSPGIATLALAFLAMAATAESSALPDPLEAGWQGEPVCEKLHEDQQHRILRCTFPPGVGHERHHHRAHFGYAVAGGRMRINGASGIREVDLSTGSSYTSDGVAAHDVLNIGDSTVVYLIVEPKDMTDVTTLASRYAAGFMTNFPDMIVRPVKVTREGDPINFHWRWTGTNTGPGGTGNAVDLQGFEQWLLDGDGPIVESHGHMDDAEYQRQLNADVDAPKTP